MKKMLDIKTPEDIVEVGAERIFTKAEPVPPPAATFTVSARNKPRDLPVFQYLRKNYGNLRINEVDSLFGFVEKSTLYGGRGFTTRELSDKDVRQLNSAGIGIRIPMSNHTVADYRLDASVIKNIKTHAKIEAAMELYDSVVLPMPVNEELDFLAEIKDKDKITLFANAGCALTCPSRICYASISKINKGRGGEFQCSQPLKDRDMHGMVDFPLQPYIELGFHRFKLLRARPSAMTGF